MNLTVDFFLCITRKGSVKVTKNAPSLGPNEVSMAIRLRIPTKVFDRPQFKAELIIPETAIQSGEVGIEFTDALQQAIQQQTGYDVVLSLMPTEQKGGMDGLAH